ncbi:hypothetical protein DVJ78_18285 (plasmid) [Humibacter sp. BT305]|nr:hypothetical protein DVJ78_18285 [Humibacter sp. BT305]
MSSGGGAGMEIPREQVPQFQASVDECDKELGFEVRPLTTDEYSNLYNEYLDSLQCLRDAGYALPEPPTEQTFVDTYQSEPWSPWTDLPIESQPQALQVCPQPTPIY